MVKTRITCSLENELSKSLSGISRNGRRVNPRRTQVMYNQYKEDEDEDSEESGYAAVPPKDRVERKSKFEGEEDDDEEEEEEEAEAVEEEVEEEEEEEAEQEEEDEEEEDEDEDEDEEEDCERLKITTRQNKTSTSGSGLAGSSSNSSIRRSTRQRKPIYDTLNQSWLLGSSRLRDFTTAMPNVMVHPSREVASSQKINENEEEESNSLTNDLKDYRDMYSRVKRERQKPKQNVYRMEKGKGVDTTEEDEEGDDEEESTFTFSDSSIDGIAIRKSHSSKYCLRQTKPAINRFQVPVAPVRNRRVAKSMLHVSSPPRIMRSRFEQYISPACKDHVWKKRRRATHHTSSSSGNSSSSSSGDERQFDRHKAKSMTKARNRCLPLNLNAADIESCGIIKDRIKIGSSLADVDPMSVDREVNFESVGGLSEHLQSLKEMIIFPLLYPEVFDRFKITPPRGVLFYGPPGTGKTLVARALANECSQEDKRVAFFMRKGADCLSKWVGESERQLRLLFDQAYALRPSIIFFDEIDGLAPVRSSRQDQIHSSIVSTLLALMDGLDSRGEVVVVGATNRLDAIDPALRRPGRFDREFSFPLPSAEGRRRILDIHTGRWEPRLRSAFVGHLAEKTVGYCGADLKALCAEAALLALRRRYPQIYTANAKLQLDVQSIEVSAADFWRAMRRIVPSAHRSAGSFARALSPIVRPLLSNLLARAVQALQVIFPEGCPNNGCDTVSVDRESVDEVEGDIFERDGAESADASPIVEPHRAASISHRPRLLLCGKADQGQTSHLAPAILHHLEHLPVHRMDLPALFGVTARAPEEACAQILAEARRVLPSIVYLPHVDQWWATVSDTVRITFLTLLHDMDPSAPILLLATSDCPYQQFPTELRQLFNVFQGELLQMTDPSTEERREFFSQLLLVETRKRPRVRSPVKVHATEELPLAPPPKRRLLNDTEKSKLVEDEESTLRELRQFLRDILYKLARDRRFTIFTKPVNVEEVRDYLEVIRTPMDLETMMTKIDLHKYETVKEFLQDVDLICQNALEYNPDRDPTDKLIRHRACALRDTAHSLIDAELDPEFELMCQEVQKSRVRRGESPSRFAPKNYNILRSVVAEPEHLSAAGGEPVVANSENASNSSTMRFSRRIRGLGAPEPKGSTRKAADKTESPKTEPVITRRRTSLWFGCHGRKIIRHKLRRNLISKIANGEIDKKSCTSRRNGHMQLSLDKDCVLKDAVIHKVNGLHAEKNSVEKQITITECDVRLEVDAAVEAMLTAVCKEPERRIAAVSKEVTIDVKKLEALTEVAVSVTEACSVESLEKLYCVLSRRVVGCNHLWDRSALLKELEVDIQHFRKVQLSAQVHASP